MYCATCGAPVSQSLSFCNRCGATLRDKSESSNMGPISAFLTAITILGIVGLGVMLGGALVLRKEANLDPDMIGIFMLFTFLIVGGVEFLLIRQLSRLTGTAAERNQFVPPAQSPPELRSASVNDLVQPLTSVTDNTTRTLEYSRRDR